jgi:predicted phage tail protein
MRHYIRISKISTFALFLFLFLLGQGAAADISLAWDASTSANISGYKVYVGTASGSYGTPTAVGNQLSYTVSGLTAGTYYFAVTAVNASGSESGYSNQVSTTVAGSSITCDLNTDGSINVLDLQKMVNVVLGLASPTSSYDLNSDGKVDVLDLQIINNVVLGLRSCQ